MKLNSEDLKTLLFWVKRTTNKSQLIFDDNGNVSIKYESGVSTIEVKNILKLDIEEVWEDTIIDVQKDTFLDVLQSMIDSRAETIGIKLGTGSTAHILMSTSISLELSGGTIVVDYRTTASKKRASALEFTDSFILPAAVKKEVKGISLSKVIDNAFVIARKLEDGIEILGDISNDSIIFRNNLIEDDMKISENLFFIPKLLWNNILILTALTGCTSVKVESCKLGVVRISSVDGFGAEIQYRTRLKDNQYYEKLLENLKNFCRPKEYKDRISFSVEIAKEICRLCSLKSSQKQKVYLEKREGEEQLNVRLNSNNVITKSVLQCAELASKEINLKLNSPMIKTMSPDAGLTITVLENNAVILSDGQKYSIGRL